MAPKEVCFPIYILVQSSSPHYSRMAMRLAFDPQNAVDVTLQVIRRLLVFACSVGILALEEASYLAKSPIIQREPYYEAVVCQDIGRGPPRM